VSSLWKNSLIAALKWAKVSLGSCHGVFFLRNQHSGRKLGERVKTGRHEAGELATLHRAGELTPVWIPDQAHEAMRDLLRARQAAARSLRQARQTEASGSYPS
jgi:transposase